MNTFFIILIKIFFIGILFLGGCYMFYIIDTDKKMQNQIFLFFVGMLLITASIYLTTTIS
jgi:hypothetical protein